MKKEILDDDLQNLPAFLKDLKGKGDGYRVPNSYFDDMEATVLARLEIFKATKRPTLKAAKRPFPLSVRPQTAMALAAALMLILTAVWFIRQDTQALQPTQFASTELTQEDLESYLLENACEFDPEQLAALTPEETTEPTEATTPEASEKNSPASEELHPDDLDKILDEMTDEELEQIL